MRKLDVPYKLGTDYFIDSRQNMPFYLVPLYKEIEVRLVKENELPGDPHYIVGIFRKTGGTSDGIFTYKLDLDESKRDYRRNCRGNE